MLRWGVLGAGSVAQRRVIPAMNAGPESALSALMVRDRARAEQLAAKFGAQHAHTRVDALVNDPEVDAVYISTPVYLHAEHAAAAAAAGKHVLCEKPMARTTAECEHIIGACEQANVHLEVCFVLRGWPIYHQVREIITSGRLGRLVEIRAQLAKWTPRRANEWRLDPEQSGGGAFMDVGSHYLDLFRFLIGEVARIAYMGSSEVFGWPVEESGFALLEFHNGVHGSLSVSCAVPHPGDVLAIFGTEGSLFLGKELRLVTAAGQHTVPAEFPDYYSGLLTHFCRAATANGKALASGLDGLRNIEIIRAAYTSQRSGRLVEIGSS